MSQFGEAGGAGKPIETANKGKVKVSVRDKCTGERLTGATVIVNGESQLSDDQGEALFEELDIGNAKVKVHKHFEEADYKTFVTHKPKIVRSWEAKSSVDDLALVEEGKKTKIRAEIDVYRVVKSVRFCRIAVKFVPKLNYGHWWIEVGDKSYGWWPKDGALDAKEMENPQPPPPLPDGAGTAAKIRHMAENATYQAKAAQYAINDSGAYFLPQAVVKTFAGVPGLLNGTEELKRRERDSHHGDWKDGKTDENYHPVVVDCRTDAEIHEAIRKFAFAYSGEWSWRFELGRNCHTFQKDAMKQLRLDKVKEI